jgi:pullulanase
MNQRLIPVVLLFFAMFTAGPTWGQTSVTRGKSAADFDAQRVLVVHYHRPGADYDGWHLWVWPASADAATAGAGQAAGFSGHTPFGPYAVIAFDGPYDQVGLIVRKGDWQAKDVDTDRFVRFDRRGVAEVWLHEGREAIERDPSRLRFEPQAPPQPPARPTPDVSALRRVAPASAAEVDAASVLVVHYHRPDGRYDGWDVWAWAEGGEHGQAAAFPLAGDSPFGRYATVTFDHPADRIGFIVRRTDWSTRELGGDRFIAPDKTGVAELWVVAEDPSVYTDPMDIDFRPRISIAFLDSLDRVRLRLNERVTADDVTRDAVRVTVAGEPRPVAAVRAVDANLFGARHFDIRLAAPLQAADLARDVGVEIDGFVAGRVFPRDAMSDPSVIAPVARLGNDYSLAATTFRTWSPTAERVELLLGDDAVALRPVGRGVWEVTVEGDLHGRAYRYRFHHPGGVVREAADVHAFAATADSRSTIVVDLRRTDPQGFRDYDPPTVESPVDEVIYEVHVRDFSIFDEHVPAEHRGKYLGMTHTNAAGTSLSHLKALGVTTVHLLPVHDFLAPLDAYNWGYWTELFNVPERQYATDPHDPESAIRELKQTIQALHAAGIRVVLDVVYNHTATSGEHSPFEAAAPWHTFRTNDDGSLRNEAGVGNAIADERPMMRKYIVDSLRFWLEEYRVDGFRFDLMGMHHPETMRQIERELRAIRPDVLIYGEPWTGGGPTHFPKGAQRGMNLAVFNDHLRNAIRGDLDGTARGFAMNGSHADGIRRGVMGSIDDFADHPPESINYVSAHDNLTLWDKLEKSMPEASEAERRAMQKLSLGIVLTSQGVAFLHGGSEFARTKGGNHNSYDAGDEVNAYDWARRDAHREMVDYVAGLIELRRQTPVLRMRTADEVRANLRWIGDDEVLAHVLRGDDGLLLVAYNGRDRRASIALPPGRWTVLVNHERAGVTPLGTLANEATLPPHSMLVLRQPR